ncbi:MAG: helix-turn-helix domain-containing protein [Gemmatimonadota bacterium]
MIEASAAAAGGSPTLGPEHLWEFLPVGYAELAVVTDRTVRTLGDAVELAEEHAVLAALRRTSGNREEAARLLDVSRATLYRILSRMRDAGRFPSIEAWDDRKPGEPT